MNNIISLLCEDKLLETRKMIEKVLNEKLKKRLSETKEYFKSELNEMNNIVRMGRMNRIRRRIRRDASGRIMIQQNARRSAVRGYRVSGNTLKRITSSERIRRSLQLKRAWRGSRRAKLNRSLLKRKMSMRRRSSLGLR